MHVQLRRGAVLSAVEADRLARACQRGVLRRLAAVGDGAESPEDDPAAGETAIALHAHGTGPFARPGAIRDRYLIRGRA
ncbi:hypothetical protein [Streptomyces sp. NPDC048650]|uniref:hypothetical protein n=1 Tax=unclassified Streptomyces TaxID=2593676 RepID=UPI0037183D68